jgi:hypothetical protein
MSGKKFEAEMMAKVETLGGSEFVLDFIGDGGTVTGLCKVVGCSRSFLSRILNKRPEYRTALEEGRRLQADAFAEDSLGIVDDMAATGNFRSEDVQLAKERVSVRKWMAALNNPDKYAPKEKGITINVGNLHLDALRKINREMLDVTPGVKVIADDREEG